jgi:DHA2 family multidrug resistance protein
MAAGEQEKIDFKAWMGVWGTMLGAFMAVLDIQITNASLREITGIAATQDEGSWISTRYLMGEIVTIPLTASVDSYFCV